MSINRCTKIAIADDGAERPPMSNSGKCSVKMYTLSTQMKRYIFSSIYMLR